MCFFLFRMRVAGRPLLSSRSRLLAAGSPSYILIARATRARAGNPTASACCDPASHLDRDIVLAQLALARAMSVDGDRGRAVSLISDFRKKHPERPEAIALAALLWGRSLLRGESVVGADSKGEVVAGIAPAEWTQLVSSNIEF